MQTRGFTRVFDTMEIRSEAEKSLRARPISRRNFSKSKPRWRATATAATATSTASSRFAFSDGIRKKRRRRSREEVKKAASMAHRSTASHVEAHIHPNGICTLPLCLSPPAFLVPPFHALSRTARFRLPSPPPPRQPDARTLAHVIKCSL